jgi:hypothetical protein
MDGTALLSSNYTATANSSATAITAGLIVPFNVSASGKYTIVFDATGANASSSGNIVFTLQVTRDNVADSTVTPDWRNLADNTVAISGTARSVVAASAVTLDLSGWRYVRLAKVANSDATYTASINATIRAACGY